MKATLTAPSGAHRTSSRLFNLVHLLLLAGGLSSCGNGVPPELMPDEVLRSELGLTDEDEVHRIVLSSAEREAAEPDSVLVPPTAWVEFVSGDWRVHEVSFDLDSLRPEAASFLRASDQVDSPPLVDRDARFVVTFRGAPAGRYPFTVAGNGAPARGVVVVDTAGR